MQAAGGIPQRAKSCGTVPENTHGIPLGSTLITANNPAGLAPKKDEISEDEIENGADGCAYTVILSKPNDHDDVKVHFITGSEAE
jgi:hypothetical protein